MQLRVFALSMAFAIIWAGCILLVGLVELAWPAYGRAFLDFAASIYPGFQPGTGFGSVIVGTVYGFVDGAIGGAIFAWIYNLISARKTAGRP